ncbi:ImmA/IrrE family metallo-endopeptidase [uncultured Dokdonia sp.]|uniref:ImmA/IrrE family metallo-endopeptidase n=1 Tax=uncultured Dokdonia sp. TaxID=575653 RepID=UPI002625998A|nr:ImmA/IrrE family metallo-endopeptidase [uncultured Dokdonia sp.]
MNTTAKGDILENKAVGIIEKILNDGLIGVMKEYARVFTKKKYPSNIRGSGNVEFDLTIEIWPPNADQYAMIYFIECKNYDYRVPKGEIKKFYADIEETSGVNAKAIVITSSPLQKGAYDYAAAKKMMVIEGESKDNFNIILYKRNIEEENIIPILENTLNEDLIDEGVQSLSKVVDKQILSSLIPAESTISYGIDLLSKDDIDEISKKELNKFDTSYLVNAYGLSVQDLTEYLKSQYDIEIFNFNPKENKYLGTCDIDKKTIGISKKIVNTPRELFTIGHEFGHFLLHQKLRINQEIMNSFSDSKFDFKIGKNRLENPRHWVEWQANYFSASLLLPKASIIAKAWQYQNAKHNLIFDDNYDNQKKFRRIVGKLANHFSVSKTSVIYRLRELNMISDNTSTKSIGELISQWKSDYFV